MSKDAWEKSVDRVYDDLSSYLSSSEQASHDFVIWLAEERAVKLYDLVEEWKETKDGKKWLHQFIEDDYDNLRGR